MHKDAARNGQVGKPTSRTVAKPNHILNECLRDVAQATHFDQQLKLMTLVDDAAGRCAYSAETFREIEALFDAIRAQTGLMLAKIGSDMAAAAARHLEEDTKRFNAEVRYG